MIGAVYRGVDFEGYGCGGGGGGSNGIEGCGLVQCVLDWESAKHIDIKGEKYDQTYISTLGCIIHPRRSRRRFVPVRLRVVNDSLRIRLQRIRAIANRAPHPYRLIRAPRRLNDNIAPLPDSQRHNLGLIRYDWNEIIRHDRHLIPVNTELLNPLRTRIDQTQPVFLPRLELELRQSRVINARRAIGHERAVIIHFPIDEIIIALWCHQTQIRAHHLLHDLKIQLMKVIRQHHRAKIDIVVRILRPVDDHRPKQAAGVLRAVVRMVPRGAVEIGSESVQQLFPGRDGTLLHGRHAVFPRRVRLQQAVPMQRGAFFGAGDFVVHGYGYGVAPVRFDGWTGELSVD